MGIIIEIILQFALEFLISVIPDMGLACLIHVFKRPPMQSPVLAALGYGVLGLIIGGGSLLVFPNSFTKSTGTRVVTLFLAPIAAGICMTGLRMYRERRGKEAARIESFFFGALLAFGIAAVRSVYAQHPK